MKKHTALFSFLRNGLFWTAFTGVATLLLCGVAYYQLNESNIFAKGKHSIRGIFAGRKNCQSYAY